MTAVEISAPGGPDVLLPARWPVPVPAPGEVLIEIAAAGVNRPDILQRSGNYHPPPGASPLPGLEVAGTVVAGGSGRFGSGDKVVALTNGGGYAEYVAVPDGQVLPLPDGYDFADGAALPETLFTVQQTLIDKADLEAGQRVLIHGGAGGIGGAAIQLARLKGAIPYVTVSSAPKAAYARSLGAEGAINYKQEDFVARIREMTGGDGADVIVDIIGAAYLDKNLAALCQGGTLIVLALLGGARGQIDLGRVLSGHMTIIGSTLRPRSAAEKAAIAAHLLADVWPALADGRIGKPEIETYPLIEAAQAHRRMDAPDHFGKIVLLTAKQRK